MEGIIKRLLIVISIVCVCGGGWAMYVGQRNLDADAAEFQVQLTKDRANESTCSHQATTDADFASCASDRADHWQTQKIWLDAESQAGDFAGAGVVAVAAGILVWPFFFILRWVFVGVWRRRP